MDAYDYEKIDKTMSQRLDAIYADPKRHAFCPEQDLHAAGIRGGMIRGRRRICDHCGKKRKGHADKDEQL